MVCAGTPARGRYASPSSNMWAVVVLGIITAVFAWVWFGGRGSENKRSDTQEEQQNTEIIDKDSAKTDPQESEEEERSVTFQKDSPETQEKRHGAGIGEASLNQKGEELKCKDDEVYDQDDHLSNKSQKVEEHVSLVQPKLATSTDPNLSSATDPKLQTSTDTKPSPPKHQKLPASIDPKLSPPTDQKLHTSTDSKPSPPKDQKLPASIDPKLSPPKDQKLPASIDPKPSPPTDQKLPPSIDPKLSPPTDPKLPPSTDSKPSPPKDQKLHTSTDSKLSPPKDPKLPTSIDPKLSTPTDPKLPASTDSNLPTSINLKLSPLTDPKLSTATDSKLATLEDPKPVISTDPKQVLPPETKDEDLQNSREDLNHFTVSEKEVVQISQDILKEGLVKTQIEVSQTTGFEEQGLQVIENVSISDKEEVGKVIVEEPKQSVIKEEKLEKTKDETSNFNIPEKVVAVRTEVVTDLTHLDDVHDDGVKLVNGCEEHVQKKIATVNPNDDIALNVTDSPKQVNRSSSQNTCDQYKHNNLAKLDCTVDKKLSGTIESAADVQVNGYSLLSEESLPTNVEDVVLTSPTISKGDVLFHSSSQEEESQRDLKVQDPDSHRTKRVAAVQPIPQNVSLDFKVHYMTQSDSQIIAVTGDHEKLGEWENFIPLNCDKDGYWLHSITLPADANVEWKFVMVENGKIKRWEECSNRHIRTAHEDIATQQWWGYP